MFIISHKKSLFIAGYRIYWLARMSDGWFFLKSALNGKVLDVAGAEDKANLILYQEHGGDNQLWKLEEVRMSRKARATDSLETSEKYNGIPK